MDQTQGTQPASEQQPQAPPSRSDCMSTNMPNPPHTRNSVTSTQSLAATVATVATAGSGGVPLAATLTGAPTSDNATHQPPSATSVATPNTTSVVTTAGSEGSPSAVVAAANQGLYHVTYVHMLIHSRAPVPNGSNHAGASGSHPRLSNPHLEHAIEDATQKKRKADKPPRMSTKKQKVVPPDALAIPEAGNSIRYEPCLSFALH